MEPELFSLARRMWTAWRDHVRHLVLTYGPLVEWDDCTPAQRRAWLAAAIVARPDLAEGLTVEKGHWASGVLPTKESA